MKILAVDYGDSRTGLAVCDINELLVTPITPQIQEKAMAKVSIKVCETAVAQRAEMILLGLPLNMDGTEGERARKSRKLGALMQYKSGIPVRFWDERQTTIVAADILSEVGTFGKKRKAVLDSVSASVILEDYLAWKKNHPGEV
jgi:putative Holliday junction resolvase